MSNNGPSNIIIAPGERKAQLILHKDPPVAIAVTHELHPTKRQERKFGSTGISHIVPSILYNDTTVSAAPMKQYGDIMVSHQQLSLSTDLFNDIQTIKFNTLGKHPTQGMILKFCDSWTNRVDFYWAGDTAYRKLVTGVILTIAGGCILYKIKYQDPIAEAEFTAAYGADKATLYVRSILDEI